MAAVVFGTLAWSIGRSAASQRELPAQPEATVKQIGDALMTRFVLPLEVIGLLLTAALIGAVIIAMREQQSEVGGRKSEDSASVKAPGSIGHRPSATGNPS